MKSDTAISANLKEQLKLTVGVLEHVPEHHKDWQPGSDGKVIEYEFLIPRNDCVTYADLMLVWYVHHCFP